MGKFLPLVNSTTMLRSTTEKARIRLFQSSGYKKDKLGMSLPSARNCRVKSHANLHKAWGKLGPEWANSYLLRIKFIRVPSRVSNKILGKDLMLPSPSFPNHAEYLPRMKQWSDAQLGPTFFCINSALLMYLFWATNKDWFQFLAQICGTHQRKVGVKK